MKRILVPTDFSAYARRAADRAIRLNSRRHCRIHLVHVYDGPANLRKEAGQLLERERARLEKQIAGLEGSRLTVATSLLRGEAYVALIRHAREIDADLIVLGSKGAGNSPARVLGRTAARVARKAEMPVLVVRNRVDGPYRRPMLALPLDPSARQLARLAETISDPAAVPLPAVRAYNVPFPHLIGAGTDSVPTPYHQEMRARAQAEMRKQLASLARRGVKLRPVLRWGDARSVILAEAARMKADLVALGTHARSGIAHILLGSVAEWVLVNASADVLVARPVRFTFEAP